MTLAMTNTQISFKLLFEFYEKYKPIEITFTSGVL
jgi:hypothetical protein